MRDGDEVRVEAIWGGSAQGLLKLTELITQRLSAFRGTMVSRGACAIPSRGKDLISTICSRIAKESLTLFRASDNQSPSPDRATGHGEGWRAMRYGMVIDLQNCSGCMSCNVACKRENFTPPGVHWSKCTSTRPAPIQDQAPVPSTLCMHCDEPACLKACPTGATTKRPDGVVIIDNDICIGCGYCALACPSRPASSIGLHLGRI